MPLIVLDFQLRGPVKGLGRAMPKFVRDSLRDAGQWWHGHLLSGHFTPGNESRYGAMPRNAVYMSEIKKDAGSGQGRFVKNTLVGKSLRWMRAFPSITATQHRVTIRMVTPTYFDKPFIGSFVDEKTGQLKRVTRQPDKPAEATAVNNQDRTTLTQRLVKSVEQRIQARLNEGPK